MLPLVVFTRLTEATISLTEEFEPWLEVVPRICVLGWIVRHRSNLPAPNSSVHRGVLSRRSAWGVEVHRGTISTDAKASAEEREEKEHPEEATRNSRFQ